MINYLYELHLIKLSPDDHGEFKIPTHLKCNPLSAKIFSSICCTTSILNAYFRQRFIVSLLGYIYGTSLLYGGAIL